MDDRRVRIREATASFHRIHQRATDLLDRIEDRLAAPDDLGLGDVGAVVDEATRLRGDADVVMRQIYGLRGAFEAVRDLVIADLEHINNQIRVLEELYTAQVRQRGIRPRDDDGDIVNLPRPGADPSDVGAINYVLLHQVVDPVHLVRALHSPWTLRRLERAFPRRDFRAVWPVALKKWLPALGSAENPRQLLLITSWIRTAAWNVIYDAVAHAVIRVGNGVLRLGPPAPSAPPVWVDVNVPVARVLPPAQLFLDRGDGRQEPVAMESFAIPALTSVEGRVRWVDDTHLEPSLASLVSFTFEIQNRDTGAARAVLYIASLRLAYQEFLSDLDELPPLAGEAPADPTLAWIERLARNGRDSPVGRLTAWALGEPGPPPPDVGQFWDTGRDDVRWL